MTSFLATDSFGPKLTEISQAAQAQINSVWADAVLANAAGDKRALPWDKMFPAGSINHHGRTEVEIGIYCGKMMEETGNG